MGVRARQTGPEEARAPGAAGALERRGAARSTALPAVGNRAVVRLLGATPRPMVRRYVQLDEDADGPEGRVRSRFPDLKADSCQVADDGSVVVVPDTHWFYARPGAAKEASSQLATAGSPLRLRPGGDELRSVVKGPEPLVRTDPVLDEKAEVPPHVHAHEVKRGGYGFDAHGKEEWCLAFPNSCRMTARAILTGNALTATVGVYDTGEGTAETAPHGASPKDTEWARFPREVRRALQPLLVQLAALDTSEADALGKLEGQELDDRLGWTYLSLGHDEKQRFDEVAGINDFAQPKVGEAYVANQDYDLMDTHTRGNVARGESPRGHWAAVVMVAGGDRVTLEGFRNARQGDSTALLHNSKVWKFAMYGTVLKDQVFHHAWGDANKTTMVAKATGAKVPEGIVEPPPLVKPQRVVSADDIAMTRMFLEAYDAKLAPSFTDDQIITAIRQADGDEDRAARALLGRQ